MAGRHRRGHSRRGPPAMDPDYYRGNQSGGAGPGWAGAQGGGRAVFRVHEGLGKMGTPAMCNVRARCVRGPRSPLPVPS